MQIKTHEIQDWAERRGFTNMGRGVYEADYEETRVRLEIGYKNVRTTLLRPYSCEVLVKTDIGLVEIDEFDMLREAGVDAYFELEMRMGGETPIWFSPEYCETIEADIYQNARRYG